MHYIDKRQKSVAILFTKFKKKEIESFTKNMLQPRVGMKAPA
jgi:hypothetical protein